MKIALIRALAVSLNDFMSGVVMVQHVMLFYFFHDAAFKIVMMHGIVHHIVHKITNQEA